MRERSLIIPQKLTRAFYGGFSGGWRAIFASLAKFGSRANKRLDWAPYQSPGIEQSTVVDAIPSQKTVPS